MHIALSSDENYVQHLAVAVKSIIINNYKLDNITFHIMDNGIIDESKNKIIKIINEANRNIIFYDFKNFKEKYGFDSKSSILPVSAYSRIFIPELLSKDIQRIIYMDVDMVNEGELYEIYNIDMKGNIIAGVQDFASKKARLNNGISLTDRYINTGFLLIDVVNWNKNKITQKIQNYIIERDGYVTQEDQGAINAILKGKILILHPKYNAMTPFFFVSKEYIEESFDIPNFYTQSELNEAVKNPVVIHYLKFNGLVNRPWEEHCYHPLRNLYKKYLNKTEWKGKRLLKDKRSFKQKLISLYVLKFPFNIQKKIRSLRG